MSAASVQIIPKGLHHLEVTHKSKFFGKWPSRLPHPPHQFVQPTNRIRRWNVRPEDKVRLLVGKPGDKYIDETRGARSGWRVYTVKSVDMERNKVYLEGISNKKSSTARPKPDNFNSLSDDERKKWETESNIAPMSRPVHYSNVQLCVEDKNGPDSVFASRLATSTPYFNKGMRRLEWDRYAAKLSGTSDQVPDPERGLVRIPWPERKKEEMPPPSSALDTPDPSTSSLQLPSTSSLLSTRFGPLLPSSPRSPIPNNPESRLWADAHLLTPGPEIDASMPLFLSEELSPRFSRAKKTAGFNARREALAIEREEAARIAVEEWEAGGRDAALTEILGREGAESLEGVHIRGRTRAEVRDAALANWDAEQERTRRGVKEARRLGKTWNTELGEWVDGEQGIQREKKKERKERKEGKMLKRMEGLRLEQGRNTVVPPSVRA